MKVEILAVGTELLLGDIVNGNAAWLGRQLADAGLDVFGSAAVGDNPARIGAAVDGSLGRADAVIITGGLGPTQDDLTREALASFAGVPLVRDPVLEQALRERFAGYRRPVPEANYRQADVPVGATALPNEVGSAPGLRLERSAGVVYALPGVPAEMEAMFTATVLPDLLSRAGEPAAIVSRTLKVAGLWESAVAETLTDIVEALEGAGNPTLAFLAGSGEVRVRITAKAADRAGAAALLAPVESRVRAVLGVAVYGADDDTLPSVVHRLLLDRELTVAAAESLTGGLLGSLLSETPGSSDTFRGAVVAYATALKTDLVGVPATLLAERGPVDEDVASGMAEGVRRRLGASYGVALTGVAGPDPQGGQPPGTVVLAVASDAGTQVTRIRLPGGRAQVRRLAAAAALDALRRALLRERS